VRVLIVDDEEAARSRLARILGAMPAMDVAAEASDGLTALRLIAIHRPDAVFLDVQMPDVSGLEVATALPPEARPSVVFVTAFDRYALRAFEVSAVDYLLKPVTADRVAEAVARLSARRRDETLTQLSTALDQGPPLQRVVGKHLQQWHVLPIEAIEAFIAEQELVFAVTSQGRFLVNRTLRNLEARLAPDRFVRVHKQAIVRMTGLVVTQEPTGGAIAVLPCGLAVNVSRRHLSTLRERLDW